MRTLQSGQGRLAAGALVGAVTAALLIEGLAAGLPPRDPAVVNADPATVPEPIPPGHGTSAAQPASTTTPTSTTTTTTTKSTTTTTTTTKSVTTTTTTARPTNNPTTTTVPTTTTTRCTWIICP